MDDDAEVHSRSCPENATAQAISSYVTGIHRPKLPASRSPLDGTTPCTWSFRTTGRRGRRLAPPTRSSPGPPCRALRACPTSKPHLPPGRRHTSATSTSAPWSGPDLFYHGRGQGQEPVQTVSTAVPCKARLRGRHRLPYLKKRFTPASWREDAPSRIPPCPLPSATGPCFTASSHRDLLQKPHRRTPTFAPAHVLRRDQEFRALRPSPTNPPDDGSRQTHRKPRVKPALSPGCVQDFLHEQAEAACPCSTQRRRSGLIPWTRPAADSPP
jgi:hypothetical protein